jgi:hypothetical protein
VSLGDQADLVLIGSLVGYVIAAIMFLRRYQLVRAGAAMSVISLLPLTWQAVFTDSDAPGFAFPLMLMLPLALFLVVAGCAVWALRLLTRKIEESRTEQS